MDINRFFLIASGHRQPDIEVGCKVGGDVGVADFRPDAKVPQSHDTAMNLFLFDLQMSVYQGNTWWVSLDATGNLISAAFCAVESVSVSLAA